VTPSAPRLVAVVLVSAIAGVMNSIAGGGTLLTFPALVGLGVPPVVANATSTVALWPGALGSMWGYRRELAGVRSWAARFAPPSLLGGLAGALLLLVTPEHTFTAIVPWLVLGATLLFMVQGAVMRTLRARGAGASAPASAPAAAAVPSARPALPPPRSAALVLQLVVAVYGGYFGAGVGILMLATLGFMGLTNIHQMNGLKNWGGLCINFVAAVTFAIEGLVDWPIALAMALGATLGGYAGSRVAQRVSPDRVRQAIVAIGLASGLWLAYERYAHAAERSGAVRTSEPAGPAGAPRASGRTAAATRF
jgi:uncharacterized membrane protein YfcA